MFDKYISMKAKKTIKIIIILLSSAILIFLLILLINGRIEKRERLAFDREFDLNNPLALNSYDLISGSGPLDIIVYEDYSNNFSVDFAQTMERLQSDFSGQIRVIYRFNNSANSDLANQAALAVNCAEEQKRGLMMRKALLADTSRNILNREKIELLAEEVGLKVNTFSSCLNNLVIKERVESLNNLSKLVPVYGTPTTFVNKEIVLGARPYDTFVDSNGDEIEGLRQVVERNLN